MDDAIRQEAASRHGTPARLAPPALPERPHRIALWAGVLAIAVMLAVAATAHAHSGGVGAGGSGGTGTGTKGDGRYVQIWNAFNTQDQHWAHTTSQCESGQDPRAIGGGGTYRGAFMFTRDAWKIPAKSPGGDPISYSWKTQAVVAVLLKHKMGTKPWPVCG